jgi:hypothetical protein
MTGGFGADYTFEATGNVAVMRQAVEAARMAWGLCTVCGVAGRGETLDIVSRLLITGRRVGGSSFGGVKGRDQVPELIDRCLAGEIDVDPFISHRIRLDEVNRGFELMEAQDGIRSVIEFRLALNLDLAHVDRATRAGRLRRIHRLEDRAGLAHLLLRLEVADEDRRPLRLVEEQLESARVDAGRRPLALLDVGKHLRDSLGRHVGESHDTCMHALLLVWGCLAPSLCEQREPGANPTSAPLPGDRTGNGALVDPGPVGGRLALRGGPARTAE